MKITVKNLTEENIQSLRAYTLDGTVAIDEEKKQCIFGTKGDKDNLEEILQCCSRKIDDYNVQMNVIVQLDVEFTRTVDYIKEHRSDGVKIEYYDSEQKTVKATMSLNIRDKYHDSSDVHYADITLLAKDKSLVVSCTSNYKTKYSGNRDHLATNTAEFLSSLNELGEPKEEDEEEETQPTATSTSSDAPPEPQAWWGALGTWGKDEEDEIPVGAEFKRLCEAAEKIERGNGWLVLIFPFGKISFKESNGQIDHVKYSDFTANPPVEIVKDMRHFIDDGKIKAEGTLKIQPTILVRRFGFKKSDEFWNLEHQDGFKAVYDIKEQKITATSPYSLKNLRGYPAFIEEPVAKMKKFLAEVYEYAEA